MTDLTRLQADLGFVRASIDKSPAGSPAAVYFLWGALVAFGFTLSDVRPEWVARYWAVTAPLGAALSAYLGWRLQRSHGYVDKALGFRWAMHWGALLGVILLGGVLVQRGVVAMEQFGAIVLLLLAQAYLHAGVHLDTPLGWVGFLMAAAYIVVLTIEDYPWTLSGAAIAGALILTGIRRLRRHELSE